MSSSQQPSNNSNNNNLPYQNQLLDYENDESLYMKQYSFISNCIYFYFRNSQRNLQQQMSNHLFDNRNQL